MQSAHAPHRSLSRYAKLAMHRILYDLWHRSRGPPTVLVVSAALLFLPMGFSPQHDTHS